MRTLLLAAAAAGLALTAPAAPAAAQSAQITTSVGNNTAEPFGRDPLFPGTYPVLAQTFVAPVGTPYLQSFAFYLSDLFGIGGDLRFRASVYAFDGDRLSGTAAYESAVQVGSTNLAGFDEYRFTTENVLLDPAQTYALVLRAEPLGPGITGASNFASATLVDEYAGGALFVADDLGDSATLFAPGAFTPSALAPDASFDARFTATAVPEPTTVVLVAGGLVALVGFARRRR